MTLINSNVFTGATTDVNGGELILQSTNNLSAGVLEGVVNVNTGGTIAAVTYAAFGYGAGVHISALNILGGTVILSASGNETAAWPINFQGGTLSPSGTGFLEIGTFANGTTTVTTSAAATTAVISTPVQIHAASGNISANFNVAQGTTPSGIDLLVSGSVSLNNAGNGITKAGSGLMALSNTDTYTGATNITAGTLQLGTGQSGQDGSINNTSSVVDSANFVYDIAGSQSASYVISGTGSVVKTGPGTVVVSNNTNTYTGNLTVNGGTLQANGTANSPNPMATALGNPQNATRTITVNNGGVLLFNQSNVLGSGVSAIGTPLVINSGGLVTSNAASGVDNVLGPLTLSGGSLTGYNGGGSGSFLTWILSAGSVTVNTAPSLIAVSGATNPGINMAATTTFNVVATGGPGPDLTVAASLGDQAGAPQFSGSSAFSASLVKTGPGTMLLASSDSYSGTTLVNAGTLVLGDPGALLMSSFNTSGAGSLSFGTLSGAIFGGLTSSGTLALTNGAGSAPIALSAGANNNNSTFSGTLSDAGLGGSLTKIGTGTLTSAGTNTYIGPTLVSSGAIALTGSLGNTAVTVASGATLSSSSNGYIGGNVNVNGGGNLALALGNSANPLTVGSGLTLGSSSGGYGAGNYATLSYTVSSNGTQPVNLGASALTVNSGGAFVNVSFTATPPAGAVYPLMINVGSQNLAGSFSLDPSSPGVTSLPLGRDTYNLVDAGNSLELQIIGPPVPGVAYFYGAVSNNWSDLSNSTSSNWSADAAATQDAGNVPGSITDVIFSANNLSGSAVSTVLGANFAINSLNVNATAASTTIGNPGDTTTLTIYALADSNTNSSGYTGNPAGNGISIAAGAGPVTINVPVLLGGSQTWTNGSTGEFTVTGSIQGTAAAAATQTLTLSDSGGGTIISGSIVDGTVGGNLAVVVNNTGAGTTVFAGSNTYTGGTTINAGTLQVASANGLPSGAGTGNVVLSSTGGATLDLDGTPVVYINGLSGGGGTALGQVINSASGTVATLNLGNGGGSGSFAGVIADNNGVGGQVALVKSGSGTEVLSASNSYSGGTVINAGRLSLANPAALSSGTIQFGGGTLQFSPSNTNDYSTLIFNSSGPISLDTNGQSVTFASNLDSSNVGGLTKAGSGTLVLSGNNAYSGATLISAGTLSVTGTGGLASSTSAVQVGTTAGSPAALVFGPASVTNLTAFNAPFTVADGSTVTVPAGASFTTAGFVKIGSAQNTPGTFNQTGGTVSINGSDVNNSNRALTIGEFGGEASTYNLSGGSLSVPNAADPVIVSWSGTGTLNISGGTASFGKLELGDGAATTPSTVNLTGGVLYLGSGGMVALAHDTPNVNLGNATVGATAAWSSSVPLTLTYTGGTNFDTTGGNITLSGVISGSGGLTTFGTLLTLGTGGALANTFSGSVVVSGGTLQANGTANSTNPTATPLGDPQIASRTITVNNGGVLLFNQANTLGGGGSIIQTPLVINNGGLVTSANNLNNVLGPLTLSGGTLAGGNGGASGKFLTYQLASGSVTVNTAPSLIAVSGGTSAGINMGQTGVTTTTFNVGLTGTAGTASANPDLTVAANLGDLPGALQFSGSPGFSASLVKTGAGTMLLASSDSYSGTTLVNGGALVLGDPGSLLMSTFDTSGSGTLSFGTLSSATFGGLQGATGTLALTDSTGSVPVALTVGNNNNGTTFSGTLGDAGLSGSLTKIGTGTLTLSGTNTYLGGTTVDGGTLIATNSQAIFDGTNLSVGDPALLGLLPEAVVPSPVVPAATASVPSSVPEPGSLLLLIAALASAATYRQFRRR